MGVYIKGMEMPQNCEECDVKVVCKNYWKLIREQHTRPSWCPLAPVPPHGRLIDADALKSEIAEEDDGFGHDVYTAGIHDGFALSFECIDEAPTILEAEEGET